ncbi:MAG: tRNA (guanine(46)-N(7))-methyltransferase TrmB [Rhodospirillaceae bacterium]|nr:tRNA (guanine(46)-N(7))-methyltransferase TrmB [Rhodospirillaceae bacterium]
MSEQEPPAKPRFFGRRQGRKLRPARAGLLETSLPALRIPLVPGKPLDPWALFPSRPNRLWLEIGFGAGEHTAWQAEHNPDVGILASEVFVNGVASLLRHIDERGLRNIRIHPEDARPLIAALPDGCLDRVFLLHPDPWPKARHAERRFVHPANLDALARAMADGAELRIASDHPVYQVWALEQMGRRRDFEWLARRAEDWRLRPADWPETRYEAKAKSEGRKSLYLRYRRVARG